eukprot:GHVR01174885.1.p1 GENE.GHVR01174885.1~~GHVR01174885.1.p1  ORF type:complete len:135 (-),score=6.08 GHVR01174885.1:805-1209(-)
MMRNQFPFSKSSKTNQNTYGTSNQEYNNSPWQQNNNQNFNYQGSNQSNQSNQMGMGGMGGFNSPSSKQPPIPFGQGKSNVTQIIASSQKYVGESRTIFMKLKNEHSKAVETIQTLDIIKNSLKSEEDYLRKENY